MGLFDSLLGFGGSGFMNTLRQLSPLLQLGGSVVGGIMQNRQQKKAYDSQSSAITGAEQANRAALVERDATELAKSRESIGQRARQAAVEKARMAAINAESGASGNTAARMMNSVDAGAGMDIAMLEGNQDAFSRQIAREMSRETAKANSQRSSLSKPSWLSTGLGILGAGINYGQQTAPTPRSSGLQIR